MLYILANPEEIYSILKISAEMDIILKLWIENNVEYLYITSIIYDQKLIMEKLSAFYSRLYHTTIKPIESYVVMNQNFNDPKVFVL